MNRTIEDKYHYALYCGLYPKDLLVCVDHSGRYRYGAVFRKDNKPQLKDCRSISVQKAILKGVTGI